MNRYFEQLLICVFVSLSATAVWAGQDVDQTKGPKEENAILITAEQLEKRLSDKNIRIIDVRPREAYQLSHIPGAVHVDVGDWKKLAVAEGGLQDAKGWSKNLSPLGIQAKSQVVAYGDKISNTARIWWLLKYVGVEKVSLLDGGWDWWTKNGGAVDKTISAPAATVFKPKFQADRLAEKAAVQNSLKNEKTKIVDTRSDEEFSNGRIPQSVHLEWKHLLKDDGRFKARDELNKVFTEKDILPDDTAVCY